MSNSFLCNFQVEGEKYDFALAFPYSYSRCKLVEQKIAKRTDCVRLEPFAKSIVSTNDLFMEQNAFKMSAISVR